MFNRGLKVLNLRHNMVGDEGARGLARGLSENPVLEELDLTVRENSGVRIGSRGLESLALATYRGGHLKRLRLSGHEIMENHCVLFPTFCTVEVTRPRIGHFIVKRKRFFFW